MKRRYWISMAVAVVCLAALVLSAACQSAPKSQVISRERSWVPTRIAVLPYERVQPTPGGGGAAWGPLTRAAHIGGSIIPGAEQTLDKALARMLPRISSIPLVPASKAGPVFDSVARRDLEDTLRQEIMATGGELGADAVMLGYVYRFSQRVGGPYAATTPAAVSFDLAVVRTRDGAIIWRNAFEERQKSLSQDFLRIEQFMKYGMRWYTAQEMGTIGMEQLLSAFPWKKPATRAE